MRDYDEGIEQIAFVVVYLNCYTQEPKPKDYRRKKKIYKDRRDSLVYSQGRILKWSYCSM
jgi:hypothetical protein